MDINIRKVGVYVEVKVNIDNVEHDLGLIEGDEIISLASQLSSAASELLECLD